MLVRLPFNLILEILSDKTYFQGDLLFTSRIQNPVWTLMIYFQYFEQICIWQVWKAGMHSMVWVLLCKYTCVIEIQVILFQWLKEKPKEKNNLKGNMKDQTAAALIILTGDIRLLKWEESCSCCFLAIHLANYF